MSLLDTDVEQLVAGSNYKFSATSIDKLGASEYTLVTIVIDVSSSVASFADQLESCLKSIFNACNKSPRRDNLMLRVVQFNHALTELHGFKLFGSIKEDDYTKSLVVGGATALYDAMDEALAATLTYGNQLQSQDYFCNGIIFVVTDGENNRGNIYDPADIQKTLKQAQKSENLESISTILVGVTGDDVNLNHYLQNVKDNAGFTQYISIGTATPSKLAKLAEFVSSSISSTSSALGSGAPSTPANFSF